MSDRAPNQQAQGRQSLLPSGRHKPCWDWMMVEDDSSWPWRRNSREPYAFVFPKSTSSVKRDMPHIWAGTGNAEIHPVRVLVVDNDVRVREILVQRLRGRGYDADGAQSAAEAFDLLSSAIYDIILLDVVMPRNAAIEVMTIL